MFKRLALEIWEIPFALKKMLIYMIIFNLAGCPENIVDVTELGNVIQSSF